MKQGSKRTLTILLTLLLFAAACQLNIFTAQAFSVRKTDPSRKDSHYYSGANPFYAGGYTKECTWYVWGRAYEALGAKPKLSTAAAHRWYQDNINSKAYAYGSKPKVGSVMVTVKDKSHGHVAFVEELYDNGTMLISEYNYNVRGGFSTRVIQQLPAGARRGRAHKVLGYIYVVGSKPAEASEPARTVVEANKVNAEQSAASSELKATNQSTAGKEPTGSANNQNEDTTSRFPAWRTERMGDNAGWLDTVFSSESAQWKRPVAAADRDPELNPSFWNITNAFTQNVAQDAPRS